MNIEVFIICDAATDSQGKLNILGAFDIIYAKSIPAVNPQCAIAIKLRLNRGEAGKHEMSLQMIDANGKAVIPQFEKSFDGVFKGEENTMAVNMILNIQNIKLEVYGEYAIRLMIDGQEKANLPLIVKKTIV